MRQRTKSNGITLHVIAGSEAVLLGLDVTKTKAKRLLGFAISRLDHETGRTVWLRGGRRFEHDTRRRVPDSREAPIQAFLWGDYTVDPGKTYTYEVFRVVGDSHEPVLDDRGVATTVSTESPDDGVHGVFFNRGVAGSQAYRRKFQDYRRFYHVSQFGRDSWQEQIRPEDVPRREAWSWLSRGLEEAMLAFIRQAKGPDWSLRASVYEFDYAPIVREFAKAVERGVDVRITRHAKETSRTVVKRGKEVKEKVPDGIALSSAKAIRSVGFEDLQAAHEWEKVFTPRKNTVISHNKFIVLLHKGKPVQVWTGSTNFTAGGIFGQSNVGHIVRNSQVASAYLEYWNRVCLDPKPTAKKAEPPGTGFREWNEMQLPDLEGLPEENSVTVVFSPRPSIGMLEWYAERMSKARKSLHFTAAFGVAQEIAQSLMDAGGNARRYLLLEKRPSKKSSKKRKEAAKEKGRTVIDYYDYVNDHRNHIAFGDVLRDRSDAVEERARYLDEVLAGLNKNVEFMHTKYALIDPLTDDPIVITGSANFSASSTRKNDENMLVIRGNTRIADIFLTEFMRLFRHFQTRNEKNQMRDEEYVRSVFLVDDAGWVDVYFEQGTAEYAERRLFA